MKLYNTQPRMILLQWLGFGLILHTMGALLLQNLQNKPKNEAKRSVAVQLNVHEQTKIIKSRPSSPKPKTQSAASSASASKSSPEQPKNFAKRQDYEILLPKQQNFQLPPGPDIEANREGSFAQHQWKHPYTSKEKQDLLLEAGSLSGLFDVPLAVRKIGVRKMAFTHIQYNRVQRSLVMLSLDGEPMLRAALYEPMQRPEVQKIVRRIAETVPNQRFSIYLYVQDEEAESSDINQTFQWRGPQLAIYKTAPPIKLSSIGSIPLPDEDAKKAVRRDLVHRDNLIHSAAFQAPLGQILLCQGC